MELSLTCGCIFVNLFFIRNFTKMVTRATRDKGTTNNIHFVALAVSTVAILILCGMVVATFYPTNLAIYRYLQDAYFAT